MLNVDVDVLRLLTRYDGMTLFLVLALLVSHEMQWTLLLVLVYFDSGMAG